MRRFVTYLLTFLLLSSLASAQPTKVRGRVTDAHTGEAIPFAGVYFKGTTIGTSTDSDGRYSIEARIPGEYVLVCQLLGYDVQEKRLEPSTSNTVNFQLQQSDNHLDASSVKPDNRKIKRLLRNINQHKADNDPDRKPGYGCELYNKMEFGLADARDKIRGRKILEQFGFVFDYMDTSDVSGVSYLPIMLSETVSQRHHQRSSDTDREVVLANRISGINAQHNLLSQFTGSAYLKNNFYRDFVNTLGVEFPSPIQDGGLLYYNYYIIDSLRIDGRKNILVRFHPKNGISSPALDGQMHIDAEDFALTDIKGRMNNTGNVNWLRDLEMEVTYRKDSSGYWFFDTDRMYADFCLTLKDSTKNISVIGNRQLVYRSHSFTGDSSVETARSKVEVTDDANSRDDAYWEEKRPYELNAREKNIYTMVDSVKQQKLYRNIYKVAETLVNGYWDFGKIGIGPYARMISYDSVQGFRTQLGVHTSTLFSTKRRYSVYAAYGFGDHKFKGGGTFEWMFRKKLTRKLTVDAYYDLHQLGRKELQFTEGTLLSSLTWGRFKMSPLQRFSALYEHEFSPNFNFQAEIILRRQYSNALVPMERWDGTSFNSVAANELHLQGRFSYDEVVNRGHFIKTYVSTSYPVVTLDVSASAPGLRKDDYGYLTPSVNVDWRFKLPPVGISKVKINAGKVFGKVPYPYLHIFPGDWSFFNGKYTFNCMEPMEFVSDSWAHIFYEHDFGGFFLGKIPLIRQLNWRETFTLKAAFGVLSDKNNGTDRSFGSIMRFPSDMGPLKEPYLELGAGISNILRLVRVDFHWRVTNLENASRRFVVTTGLELKF